MKKILVAVRKISDLTDPEIGNYFECVDCGAHLFYAKVPTNDNEELVLTCSNCGKIFPGL